MQAYMLRLLLEWVGSCCALVMLILDMLDFKPTIERLSVTTRRINKLLGIGKTDGRE